MCLYIYLCRNLSDNPDCEKYVPVNPDTNDLYVKCTDGVLFW